MSNVAIITARGGSKRIPKKNIRDFLGKPIIAYSISAALESRLFDEVMVSTDSSEIAEVAEKFGAKIPFLRSEKNSDDYSTTADVLHEVLTMYKERGKIFDLMCCIYPTAPFITAKKLLNAATYLNEKCGDALMPVVPFSFPPLRGMVIRDGGLCYKWQEYAKMRSQDLELIYHDAGQFYFYDAKKFAENAIKKIVPYILNELEVQDIDNLTDWKLAEIKFQVMEQNNVDCYKS